MYNCTYVDIKHLFCWYFNVTARISVMLFVYRRLMAFHLKIISCDGKNITLNCTSCRGKKGFFFLKLKYGKIWDKLSDDSERERWRRISSPGKALFWLAKGKLGQAKTRPQGVIFVQTQTLTHFVTVWPSSKKDIYIWYHM